MIKYFMGIMIGTLAVSVVRAGCPLDHFLVGQDNGKLIVDFPNSNVYRHWNADYGSNPNPYGEKYYEFMGMYGGGYTRSEPGFSQTPDSRYVFSGVSGIHYNILVERVYATPGLHIYDDTFNAILKADEDTFCLSAFPEHHAHLRYVIADNPETHYEIQYRLIDSLGTYAPSEVFSLWFGSYIPGDANKDGKVDVSDLGILAANYGTTAGATWGKGDFNDDDKVDVSDLGILAANYGTGTGSARDFDQDACALGLKTDNGSSSEKGTNDGQFTVPALGCGSAGLPVVVILLCLIGLLSGVIDE